VFPNERCLIESFGSFLLTPERLYPIFACPLPSTPALEVNPFRYCEFPPHVKRFLLLLRPYQDDTETEEQTHPGEAPERDSPVLDRRIRRSSG